jgi:hypothetical protein
MRLFTSEWKLEDGYLYRDIGLFRRMWERLLRRYQ